MKLLDPDETALFYRNRVKTEIEQTGARITIVGFLASDNPASITYAKYTQKGCESVGIKFKLNHVTPETIEEEIRSANFNKNIHGIFVYYPVFDVESDTKLKEIIDYRKDVEGMTSYWSNKLYANQRFDDVEKCRKSILPCTPLAIIKLLEATNAYAEHGLPFQNQTITIFNRSEVVGKPLAYMLTNDGAKVFSFDLDGCIEITTQKTSNTNIQRSEALKKSDVVITGIPSKKFIKVKASELKKNTVCLNFSTIQNYENDAIEVASIYIPRVGPLTVAMCLRNALRLYKNYHNPENKNEF